MRIAILSDSHGRNTTVLQALALINELGLTTVIHCGDIEDPTTLRLFAGLDAHFVPGNCDHDIDALRAAAANAGVTFHDPYGHLELAGRSLAFLHGHDGRLMRDLVASGAYDFLFHGHTHLVTDRVEERTRIINPGALYRAMPKTLAVLDLVSGDLVTHVVAE